MRWRGKVGGDVGEVVLGVVAPGGVSGSQLKGQAWTYRLKLAAWRRVSDTEPVAKALTVSKSVSKTELDELMRGVFSYAVVRVRVVLGSDGNAELVDLLDKAADDPELRRRSEELQVPVTIEVAPYGTFTFDRSTEWWQADTLWLGTVIQLTLSCGLEDDIGSLRSTADALWTDQAGWDARIRAKAVEELLELANDWAEQEDENAARIDSDEFARRITLESVAIEDDGSFVYWFADGDLFWGHSIAVSGTLAGGPDDATMQG